jgi:hypothetical protein
MEIAPTHDGAGAFRVVLPRKRSMKQGFAYLGLLQIRPQFGGVFVLLL